MIRAHQVSLASAADPRGLLTAVEFPKDLPFSPVRVFIVTDSPPGTERGGHAHRECHQFVLCPRGSVAIEIDDDEGIRNLVLSTPDVGVYIPPLVWAKQTYITAESSLVVLANLPYDANDYVDNRDEAAALRSVKRARRT